MCDHLQAAPSSETRSDLEIWSYTHAVPAIWSQVRPIDKVSPTYAIGSGETRWNRHKIGAEPDLVAFHI